MEYSASSFQKTFSKMKIIKQKKYQEICISDEISEMHFISCDFTRADMSLLDISNCIFEHCDFSLTNLKNTQISDVKFQKCKLIGVNFEQINNRFSRAEFDACLIDTCNFSDLDLRQFKFKNCVFQNSTFLRTNLEKINFQNCTFPKTQFEGANLKQTNFSTAREYFINPKNNNIAEAKFSLPEALSLLHFLEIELVD